MAYCDFLFGCDGAILISTMKISKNPVHGQQVITACAFIRHNFDGAEKVFLAKRAHTKKFLPGVFELPGGHIDFGEDIVEGLKREITEELGMRVRIGDPFFVFTALNEAKGLHYIEVVYFAAFEDPIENVRINPEDHSEFQWVAENEVSKFFTENKGEDDPEMKAVKKGFELLQGEALRFG